MFPTDFNIPQTRQDITDHATFIQAEWIERVAGLQRERGIWGGNADDNAWSLDFTEGVFSSPPLCLYVR